MQRLWCAPRRHTGGRIDTVYDAVYCSFSAGALV